MGKPYEDNPEYLTFDTLGEGSVVAWGSLTVPDSSSTTDASNSLKKVLTEGSIYGDMKILRVVINDGEEPPETATETADLGLILGLSIPLLLILLSLILIAKVKSSQDEEDEDTENIDDEIKES